MTEETDSGNRRNLLKRDSSVWGNPRGSRFFIIVWHSWEGRVKAMTGDQSVLLAGSLVSGILQGRPTNLDIAEQR